MNAKHTPGTVQEIELAPPAKAQWIANHKHITAPDTGEIRITGGGTVKCDTAIADADTPELAAQIVAEHNTFSELVAVLTLAKQYLDHPDVQAFPFSLPACAVSDRIQAAITKAIGGAK